MSQICDGSTLSAGNAGVDLEPSLRDKTYAR